MNPLKILGIKNVGYSLLKTKTQTIAMVQSHVNTCCDLAQNEL